MNKKLSWEDMVFEYRNQEYGAYDVRKAYPAQVVRAFILAIVVLVFIAAFPLIKAMFEEQIVKAPPKKISITDLAAPPPIDPNIPPPPKFELPPPVKEALKFVTPKPTEKEVVEEEIPTIEELKTQEIASETNAGDGDLVFEEPVEEVIAEPAEDPNKVWLVVEQAPEFPGGMASMMKFLRDNTKYPAQARRMGTEGSVYVSFVIDSDGRIADVQTIKGISADLDKEAMRVISSMPPWKPGKQNGKAVRVRFVLPVKFQLG